ncbi:MFS transporter [Pseudoclavibacter sp. CFCC 11306]|nr:MFS transporter [Pseudoclavibacter sp. CFCC 11306]
MSTLVEVCRIPHIVRLMGSQCLSRLPQGALSILLLVHSEIVLGSYAAAGLVVAVFSVAAAASGPLLGRMLSVFGMRIILLITVVVDSAAIALFGVLPPSPPALFAVSVVIGLFTPPILPAVRSFYPQLTPPGMSAQVFSLDSITQEVVWAVGPIIATVLLPLIGTSAAFLTLGLTGLVGGLLIAGFPLTKTFRLASSRHGLGGVLLKWPVLIAVLSSILFNASYGAAQTGVVATFAATPAFAGLVLAAFAVASVIAGTISVSFQMHRRSLAVRQIPTFVALIVATLSGDPWWLGACMAVAGLGAAPALAVMHNTISSSLRPADAAEAVGWMGSAMLSGIAIGSAAGGYMVDHFGATSAICLAALFSASAIALAFGALRVLPDLSLHAGPPTDTSAVPVIRLPRRRVTGGPM